MTDAMPAIILNNVGNRKDDHNYSHHGHGQSYNNGDDGNGQLRKGLSNLKVPSFDDRFDSGIDSFKESDLLAIRSEAQEENKVLPEHYYGVTKHLETLSINEDCDYDDDVCPSVPVCGCLTSDAFNQDEEGDTPLHSCIIYRSFEFAEKFISCAQRLENLSIQNKLRQTPMHLAVIVNQPVIVRQLVVAGAALEMQDHNGQTALHLACKYNYKECIHQLTQQVTIEEIRRWPRSFILQNIPQNLDLQNFEGYTCLHLAAFADSTDLLMYLVYLGADVNARDGKSGRTALHHAVERGRYDLMRFLIEKLKADVDVLTFDHCTPLHLAVSRKFSEAITLLMDANADRLIMNSEGLKAFEFHST